MEILTHLKAWHLFYAEFRGSDKWGELSAKEKNALIVADRDANGRRAGSYGFPTLGFARAKKLIECHAPGMFEWVIGAKIKKPSILFRMDGSI